MNLITADQSKLTSSMVNIDLIRRYVAFLDAKPRTVEAYYKNLKRFYEWLQGQGIVKPERKDIIAYRDHLQATKSANTTQAYLVAVRLFFQWTASEGLYPNIAEHVKSATVSKAHKKDHMTTSQVKNVLEAIDRKTEAGKRDYAMLLLMFTGGLRTIEVSRALVEDMRALGDHTVLYVQGKGRDDKDEYVKIAPVVEEAIRSYLAERGATEKEHLFTSTSNNNKGNGMTTRAIRAIVKDRYKAVGLDSDRLTAHSTRHTAITLALLNGSTVQEAQQFARHSDISTTMIYAHNLEKINNTCAYNVANALVF